MFDPDLLNALKHAQHIVILTGAGVSAESGIPTFRDALTGLWKNYSAEQLASAEAFIVNPALVWGWYEWRRGKVLQAQPNPAHSAIARLERIVPKLTLITQNVDDLHERAGSRHVVHLHGSLHHPRCIACEQPYALPVENSDNSNEATRIEPPRCPQCGEYIRPGVVWFGEYLPADALKQAEQAAKHCDVLISIGTSGMVRPAANLPYLAKNAGSPVVQINPEHTDLDWSASFNLHDKAGIVLPQLVDAVDGLS